MPFETRYLNVGGVQKPYYVSINNADGTNGLLGDNPQIIENTLLANGVPKLYWRADCLGDLSGASLIRPTDALFWSTAYSPDNFDLVTGDSVNTFKGLEETTGTDLTQGTSANQAILVEANTVTQFTASNQPAYDQVSGVDVIATGYTNTGIMEFSSPISLTSNWAWRMVFKNRTELGLNQRAIQYSDDSSFLEVRSDGQLRIYDDLGGLVLTTTMNVGVDAEIVISLDGTDMTFYDGVTQQTVDVTGKTFTKAIKGVFSSNSGSKIRASFTNIEYFETAIADVTNIVETPKLTLTPDPTKMRTSANANPTLGQDFAKLYADEWSGYRDNHVLFDPVKYMEGFPAQAGDFTYIFKYKDNDQATAGAIVSSNIDASGIFNVDTDTTDLRAGDGTGYLFDNTGDTSYRVVAYLKSGNDVYNVTDYVFSATQDATGKAFNLTSLGKATSGKLMEVKEFGVYGSALSGDDLDYFYYERDVNTGGIEQPPQLPVKAFGVNSATLSGTNQAYTANFNQSISEVTLSSWLYITSASDSLKSIIRNRPAGAFGTQSGFALEIERLAGVIYVSANTGYEDDLGNWVALNAGQLNLPQNTWIHLAMTVVGNVLKIYVNAVDQSVTTANSGVAGVSTQSADVEIGCFGGARYHAGGLFQSEVFSKALSQSEITALYANGIPQCFEDRDQVYTDNSELAPRLGNWVGTIGQEVIDQSSNALTVTPVNTPTYTNQGLTVECSP